jgi:hypothetical protein
VTQPDEQDEHNGKVKDLLSAFGNLSVSNARFTFSLVKQLVEEQEKQN